jgi:hypothetical protein
MFFCKSRPQYTLVPQSDGGWAIRHNWSNIPYVLETHETVEAAKIAVENLKRKPIDLW